MTTLLVSIFSINTFAVANEYIVPLSKFHIRDVTNCDFSEDYLAQIISSGLIKIYQVNPELANELYQRALISDTVTIVCSVKSEGHPNYNANLHWISIRPGHGRTLDCNSRGTIFHEYLHSLGMSHDAAIDAPSMTIADVVNDPVYSCHLHSHQCLINEYDDLLDTTLIDMASRSCGNIDIKQLTEFQ